MTQYRVTPRGDPAGKSPTPLEPIEPSFDPDLGEQSGIRLRALRSLDVPSDPLIEVKEVYLDELDGLDPEMRDLLQADASNAASGAASVEFDDTPVIEVREVPLDELGIVDLELLALLEAESGVRADDSPGWERVDTEVNYTGENNFFSGLSRDVSEGGLFVTTWQPFPVGTNVMLSVSLPGGRGFTAPGVVQFVTHERDDGDDMPPGMGVAFLRLTDADRATIRQFCRKRRPTYYDVD